MSASNRSFMNMRVGDELENPWKPQREKDKGTITWVIILVCAVVIFAIIISLLGA